MRLAAAVAAGVLAAGGLAPAGTPSVLTVAESCRAQGLPERLCKSIEAFGSSTAHVCRFASAPAEACALLKGSVIDTRLVSEYESSWVHRALGLQRALGSALPLGDALFPSTHNSFNSAAYPPTLSGLDANQQYSLTDQLRMDMRGLELDVHWFPSLHAEAGDGGRAPLLCHATGPHVGCTIERTLRDGLGEIRLWLDAHPDEVLLLYLEDHLDDETGHARGAEMIEDVLGTRSERDVLFRPVGPCEQGLPLAVSSADVLAAGRQVIIASACGVGPAWRTLVHSQDDFWVEDGPAEFRASPPCGFRPEEYASLWTRYFEDSTWLTTMVNGSSTPLTAADTAAMVRCGVNMPSFDQLAPSDGRLEGLIWSWATDEPSGTASPLCARSRADGRFDARSCSETRAFACVAADGEWSVSTTTAQSSGGAPACSGATTFAVPRSAVQNERLIAAKRLAGVSDVWLNYTSAAGEWSAGA
jgi:hypothetical protein